MGGDLWFHKFEFQHWIPVAGSEWQLIYVTSKPFEKLTNRMAADSSYIKKAHNLNIVHSVN